MGNKIFIEFSIFNISQMMFVIKDGKPQEPEMVLLDDIRPKIHMLLDTSDISEVEFKGHNIYVQKFAQELFQDLKTTKYANRNVRILTNGEVFTE